MRAENQSMLVQAAQGQETVQAIFTQTFPKEQGIILNCQFERDPADGKLYYVFSGTSDHYIQFRELMADYGVRPAHEIEGHRFNSATQAAAAEEAGLSAPVVDTAPDATKSSADTSESPELSATEGVVVTPAPLEPVDVTAIRSTSDANGGQPAPVATGQAGSGTGGDVDDGSRSGAGSAPAGNAGGEAVRDDALRAVDGAGVEDDPFDALTGTTAPADDPNDPFAGI